MSTDAGRIDVGAWVVFAYLLVNTLANFASSSRVERYAMGSVSAVAALGTLVVALG